MEGTDAATIAFAHAVKQQVLGSQLTGVASALGALANVAVEKQAALVLQVMDRLDVRLAERIGRLQNALYIDIDISVFLSPLRPICCCRSTR